MHSLTIFHPDVQPSPDRTGWINHDVGTWHLGPNLMRIIVCVPPHPALSDEEAIGIRDAEFQKMRHRGLNIVPQYQPADAGPDLVTR